MGQEAEAGQRRQGLMARDMIQDDEKSEGLVGTYVLPRAFAVERVKGIEPSLSAWELARPRGSAEVVALRCWSEAPWLTVVPRGFPP